MLDQHTIAIFRAHLVETIDRNASERFEQDLVQQVPVPALRQVQAGCARGERKEVADPPVPLTEISQDEQGGVHEIEVDQRAVKIIKSHAPRRFDASIAGLLYARN